MVLYLAIKQRLYHADIGSYTAYGLAAWEIPPLRRKPAVFIPDVTADRREARHLARLCTVGQLTQTSFAMWWRTPFRKRS